MSLRSSRLLLQTLLPAAMGVATVVAAVLAVLAVSIIDDLGISRAQLGWVLAVFSAVSALFSPAAGRLADATGARLAMIGVFGFATAGFAVVWRAPGLGGLLAGGAILGCSQALANPATNKMIAAEFPPGRRGVITGVKQSGVQAAIFLAGVSLPALAGRAGWRAAPLALAVLCAALSLLAWGTLPARSDEPAVDPSAGGRRAPLPPATWWIAAYALLMGMGGGPVFSFLPLYGVEEVGMSEASAGLVIGLSGLVGVAARIGWSAYAERRGEFGGPLLVIALVATGSAAAVVSAATLGPWMLWLSAALGYFSVPAWNAVAMLSVITETEQRSAGRASGVVLLGFLTGLSISPPIFGWSVDRFGTYWPGYTGVGMLFAAAAVIMAWWIRRRDAMVLPAGR